MYLISHVDELYGDSHLVAIAADAALEHVVDTQFLSDLGDILRCMFVRHGRSPRDHAQLVSIQFAELGDHLLGQAVRKVVFRSVATEVLEGQHSQHNRMWRIGGSGLRWPPTRAEEEKKKKCCKQPPGNKEDQARPILSRRPP